MKGGGASRMYTRLGVTDKRTYQSTNLGGFSERAVVWKEGISGLGLKGSGGVAQFGNQLIKREGGSPA